MLSKSSVGKIGRRSYTIVRALKSRREQLPIPSLRAELGAVAAAIFGQAPRAQGEKYEHAIRSPIHHCAIGSTRLGGSLVTIGKITDPGHPKLRANRRLIQWQHKHRMVPRTVWPPSVGLPNGGHAKDGIVEHSVRCYQATIGTKRTNLPSSGQP